MWEFDAEVFVWDSESGPSWRFARLPVDVADEIRLGAPPSGGFGSVKVKVSVGSTTWSTSVFPEKASGSFVLPVKAGVRKAEGIEDGDVVVFRLERV